MEKNKAQKRIYRKTVRFTEDEVKRLEQVAEAKGIPVSELIRKKVLDLPIPERISPERLAKKSEEFRKFLYEINKIGVNINQIARYCNQYREVDCEVLARLIEIREDLRDLLDKFYLLYLGAEK